jgi:uncharacterized protein
MSADLYLCDVMHQRLRPKPHRLAYRIFSFLLDLDQLEADSAQTRLFSVNRFNLFSFYEKDRGDGRLRGLAAYVREQLAQVRLADAGARIALLTMPRVLGLAFNPLSVYFCFDAAGRLGAVLWEVDNTFGERHSYLIPVEDPAQDMITQTCAKGFYVSPFMPMSMTYRFRFRVPGPALHLHITAADAEGALLIAAQHGTRQPVTDKVLMKLFMRLPLQAALVVGGIHWEALKIWRKGMGLVTKPAGHSGLVSVVQQQKTGGA